MQLQGWKEILTRSLAVLLGLGLLRLSVWLYLSRPFQLAFPVSPDAGVSMMDSLIIKGSGAFFGTFGIMLFCLGAIGMNEPWFRRTTFFLSLTWRVVLIFAVPSLALLFMGWKLNEFANLISG